MKIRASNIVGLDFFTGQLKKNLEIVNRSAEVRRVLKRIHGLFEPHIESARRMEVELDRDDIVAVLDALIAESERGDPEPLLACDDEVRQYLRKGMFDELVLEPSNILYTTKVSADTTRYDSMPADFWRQCLCDLKAEVLSS